MKSYARGRAYIFHILPESQRLELFTLNPLESGEFKLRLINKGYNVSTSPIEFDASDAYFKSSVEDLINIDESVVVSSKYGNRDEGVRYIWDITFDAEFNEGPLLVHMMDTNEAEVADDIAYIQCLECTAFARSTEQQERRRASSGPCE